MDLHADTVLWQDPQLYLFQTANYDNLRTVYSLSYLLDSAHVYSGIIRNRYMALGGCYICKTMFAGILQGLSGHLARDRITERLARKFFDLQSLSAIKSINKYLEVEGVKVFLQLVVPLSGGPEVWSRFGRNFLSGILTRAPDDPDATLEFRRLRSRSLLTFQLKSYMPHPRAFFFLADHRNIFQFELSLDEDVISEVFSAPEGYDGILKGMVYLVHFVLCSSAYRISEGKLLSLDVRFDTGYALAVENLLLEALSNRTGIWGDKVAVYRRAAPFLEMALELDNVARNLVDPRRDTLRLETPKISKHIYYSLYQYTNEEHLITSRPFRCRLNLGLLVLSFVELDFNRQFGSISLRNIQSILRETFRMPHQIHLKDLIMAVLVVADYAKYFESAKEALRMMLEYIDDNARLSLGILEAEGIAVEVKSRLSFKWKRRSLLHKLAELPKVILTAKEFLAPEAPALRLTRGPWSSSSYSRFERQLTQPIPQKDLTRAVQKENVEFTKSFLSFFIPWYLKGAFCKTGNVYFRPKLTQRPEVTYRVLSTAFQASLFHISGFSERFSLGEVVLEGLRKCWKPYGAMNLSLNELRQVLLDHKVMVY